MLVVPVELVDKGLYIGVWLACEIVSTVLFGILTVQSTIYFHQYKNDKQWLKALVCVVWVFELLNQIISVCATYQVLIQNFGPVFVFSSEWASVAMGLLGVSNAVLVQLFYARRAYLLNKSRWSLSLTCVIAALISFGLGFGTTIELVTMPQTQKALDHKVNHLIGWLFFANQLIIGPLPILLHQWLKEFWYIGEITTDLTIALVVAHALRVSAREYGYSSSEKGFRGLVLYTVANGFLTSIIMIMAIVLVRTPLPTTSKQKQIVSVPVYVYDSLKSSPTRGHTVLLA
ncbi:hypothetical protein DL93DRAFT_1519937 [Clavulina sp. PMI_390]|nr:hypothetical protein DL93DRAFT_1519937 [Clavulina sp. PMI_390]